VKDDELFYMTRTCFRCGLVEDLEVEEDWSCFMITSWCDKCRKQYIELVWNKFETS
jgi:hypothetical protein